MISKKIVKSKRGQSLRQYTQAVAQYILNPDTTPDPETGIVQKGEKCVAAQTTGIDCENPDGMINEICERALWKNADERLQPLSHWMLSFPEGERPSEKMLFEIADRFMQKMGYTEQHQYITAIHNDTRNLHIHILANRRGADGRMLDEGNGWYKKASRRAANEIEKEFGLQSSPGAGKGADMALRNRAKMRELKTGLKSQQRVLQEILTEVRQEITEKLKFGDVYRLLAKRGVEVKLIPHGQERYLVYSLDGEIWEKASDLHKDFMRENLEKILGKRVRPPREARLADDLAKAREEMRAAEPEQTKEAVIENAYTREQIAGLRSIPVEDVRKKFGVSEKTKVRVDNSLDVLMRQKGKSYPQACKMLAEAFPEYLTSEQTAESLTQRLKVAGVKESLWPAGRQILKQMDAWKADRFTITTDAGFKYEEITKKEVLEKLPFLAAKNVDGAQIYIRPIYGEDRVNIMVDEVRQEFLQKFAPTMLVKTSWEKLQAHYTIKRKYEKEFYRDVATLINLRFGDKAVRGVDHNARCAGFSNRKREYEKNGQFPFAKVENVRVQAIEFERFLDKQYEKWKRGEIKPLPQVVEDTATYKGRLAALKDRDLSPAQMRIGYQLQENYKIISDRSQADAKLATALYALHATPDQVYTFLKATMRKELQGMARDEYARRTAINIYDYISRPKIEPPERQIQLTGKTRWEQEQSLKNQPGAIFDPEEREDFFAQIEAEREEVDRILREDMRANLDIRENESAVMQPQSEPAQTMQRDQPQEGQNESHKLSH